MSCITPHIVEHKWKKIPVPCGRCPPCLIRRINGWAFRLLQEDKVSTSSMFVTLTYSTEHVPITNNGWMSLKKRDLQLFMKRLRKVNKQQIKYYAVGEYGTNNNRPHYHLIMFNVDEKKLVSEAWGMGTVHIGDVGGDSIAYTLKYINKDPHKKPFPRDDRQKEFSLMSKGLGKSYVTDSIIQWHKADIDRYYLNRNGYRVAMPRYYRNRIWNESEREQQSDYIHVKVEQTEEEYKNKLQELYKGTQFDYEAYKDYKKFSTITSYWANQKPRDITNNNNANLV